MIGSSVAMKLGNSHFGAQSLLLHHFGKGMSRRAPRDGQNRGKIQQTDPCGEDKKEKQHIKLRMNKQDVYISGLIHKRFSKRIHSLG